jgi:voltage-gated potassium channel Kch
MPLPVSTPNASMSYDSMRSYTSVLMGHAQQFQAAIAANSILSSLVVNTLSDAVGVLALVATISTNPTLNAAVLAFYANETGDTTDTTAANVTASAAALQALVTAILAEYPKDAQGHLLDRAFGTGGVITLVTFTASQFPTTATALTAWLATVS